MEVTLTDDQEFFRDTTRKFLEQRVPDRRRCGSSPDPTTGSSVTTGARARSSAGCRCSSPRTSAAAASAAPASSTSPSSPTRSAPRRARSAAPDQRGRRRAGPLRHRRAAGRGAPGDHRRRGRRHLGLAEPAAERSARRRHAQRRRPTATASCSRASRHRSRRAPRPSSCSSPHAPTTGLAQFLVPADAPGVTVTPLQSLDLVRRYARVEFDGVRVPRVPSSATAGRRRTPTSSASSSSRS